MHCWPLRVLAPASYARDGGGGGLRSPAFRGLRIRQDRCRRASTAEEHARRDCLYMWFATRSARA
eukprot:2322712-Alexandrium_andersonii.AAC.1